MKLEARVLLLDRAEEIFVPLERQIGIVTALEQQLPATERNGLVDLSKDLLESQHIAFGRSNRTIEGAEAAPCDTDVRVVDVAVDDVRDDAVGMLAGADLAGKLTKERGRRVGIQVDRGGAIEPLALTHVAGENLYIHSVKERRHETGDDTGAFGELVVLHQSRLLAIAQRVPNILSQIG